MKVRDYLRFMAELRLIPPAQQKKAVDEAIDKCKLADMTAREIGKLSKGYRQRVGLAQAILTSPKILLLDEPTASLDPEQINETRGIIRNCAEDAAVIFSTHIMQEIQHLCDRIVVIKQGRVRYKEHIRVTRATDATRRNLVIGVRTVEGDACADVGNGIGTVTNPAIDKIQSALGDLLQRVDITMDIRASVGENPSSQVVLDNRAAPDNLTAPNTRKPLKIYTSFPDDDAVQLLLLQRLTAAGIPVISVMPRESELEQTILHYMKN
jgi:ABC-2 type transport system ATP-binding protein